MRSGLLLALSGAVLIIGSSANSADTGFTGGGQPVSNYQPSLVLNQVIQLNGIFPSRDSGGSAQTTLGSLHTFAGNFAPNGTATASGQILPIQQNTALFSILGTQYGGNGTTNYALPNLVGTAVIGAGQGPSGFYSVGDQVGAASTTLTVANLPSHDHALPGGGVTDFTGGGQAFDNRQPSLTLTYQIAVGGAFPGNVNPFLGEIQAFAGNFASNGWLQADGRLLPISQYSALFSLLGTTYGGDGVSNFALPNLQGRLAVGAGGGVVLGEEFGQDAITLTNANLPAHLHTLPGGGVTGLDGGGQPYENAQASLGINYLMSLSGVYPNRDGGTWPQGDPLLGEIVGYAGAYVPDGWVLAQGQLLSIAQNTALFSILGTIYGGDGITNFALPDLRGRTILGAGGSFNLGETFGQRDTLLTTAQMPSHDHGLPNAGVPEPAQWILLLSGFGLVGATLRRRRAILA